MPRIAVVDASVLVSAFLFPESVPGQVVKCAGSGVFSMHLSPILVEEVRRSLVNPRLRKAYRHDEEAVLAWCANLGQIGTVFSGPLPDLGRICRDTDDDHVIAAAIAVGADTIVTGDKDLLAIGLFQTVRILTARVFRDELALIGAGRGE